MKFMKSGLNELRIPKSKLESLLPFHYLVWLINQQECFGAMNCWLFNSNKPKMKLSSNEFQNKAGERLIGGLLISVWILNLIWINEFLDWLPLSIKNELINQMEFKSKKSMPPSISHLTQQANHSINQLFRNH